MRRGFHCLVAIMDWFTRKVLTSRILNTLEADFCVEALNEAVLRFGPPDIVNTDQGSQFTSSASSDRLKRIGTRISMDGNPLRIQLRSRIECVPIAFCGVAEPSKRVSPPLPDLRQVQSELCSGRVRTWPKTAQGQAGITGMGFGTGFSQARPGILPDPGSRCHSNTLVPAPRRVQ